MILLNNLHANFCYRVCDYSVLINILDVLGTSQQGAIYAFSLFDSVNSNFIGRAPENSIDVFRWTRS